MHRFIRRLVRWYDRPLSEDQIRYWYNLGKHHGREEVQQELGPIMKVRNWQVPRKEPEPLVLGIRQRANLANFRRLFLVDKDNTREIPSINMARKHPLK